MSSCCKDLEIRKLEFLTKTKFFYFFKDDKKRIDMDYLVLLGLKEKNLSLKCVNFYDFSRPQLWQ